MFWWFLTKDNWIHIILILNEYRHTLGKDWFTFEWKSAYFTCCWLNITTFVVIKVWTLKNHGITYIIPYARAARKCLLSTCNNLCCDQASAVQNIERIVTFSHDEYKLNCNTAVLLKIHIEGPQGKFMIYCIIQVNFMSMNREN